MNNLILCFLLVLCSSVATAQFHSSAEHDNPAARANYDLERLCDPATGDYPPDIFKKEHKFAVRRLQYSSKGTTTPQAFGFDWQCMGPWNQSGRIQAIGIDSKNPYNLLAGSASGGIWRSVDAGASWVKVTAPNEQETVSAIVQDTRPGKEANWYYSTSELLSTTDRRHTANIRTHSYGNGLYRSTDKGASWQSISSTHTAGTISGSLPFRGVWNLAIDHTPLSATTLYAACMGGIMRSSDDGNTWALVLGDTVHPCFNADIVIGAHGTLYAILGSIFTGEPSPFQGLWRSTDGIQWTRVASTQLPATIRRARLAVSQQTDTIVYCLTETPTDWSAPDTSFNSFHTLSRYTYLSGDGSGTKMNWKPLVAPFNDTDGALENTSLAGYALTIAVHPIDPAIVIVGNTNLYYSTDGFTSDNYQQLGGYPYTLTEGSMHPDVHCILFNKSNPSQLFIGNDGGIDMLPDISLGDGAWQNLDNGLECAQVYHSSLVQNGDESMYDIIVSGLQDNSTYLTASADPNELWTPVSGGDGMTTGFTQDGTLLLTSWQYGELTCFYNNGATINFLGYLPPPQTLEANFYTLFALEPLSGNQLYLAETDQLIRYDNFSSDAETNSLVSEGWSIIPKVHTVLAAHSAYLATLTFDASGSNLYFGTNTGDLYRLDDPMLVDAQPVDLSASQLPKGFVAGIEQDPLDDREILVALSNYNIQSLFRTTNAGTSWEPIGGNLEEHPDGSGSGPSIRCVKILHTSSGPIYYVGTSVGLFSTKKIDGMQTVWTQEGPTTIGNLIVESIDTRNNDGTVIVSTQGGGVFKNIPANSVRDRNISRNNVLRVDQNYPNPFQDHSSIRCWMPTDGQLSIELFTALGTSQGIILQRSFTEGAHTIDLASIINHSLASGDYFLRFSSGAQCVTKKITIVR